MPRRLLLEGTDPTALLVEARQRYGAETRLILAEKVRTGGVLGFFARESFVLTVEVPDLGEGGEPGPGRPTGDAALAAELEDIRAITRELSPGVASGAEDFDAMVDRLAAGEGDDAVEPQLFSRRLRAVPPATPAPPVDAASPVEEPPSEPEEPTAGAGVRREGEVRPFVPPAVSRTATEAVDPAPTDEERPEAAAGPAEDERPTAAELLASGVPGVLLEDWSDTDRVGLADLIARLPRAPRQPGGGDVLALVGDPGTALAVARQIALWHGQPVTDAVLAGAGEATPGHGRRVRTPAAAAAARARVDEPGRRGPLVVVVGVYGEWTDADGALLESLAPTHVWGVRSGDAEADGPGTDLDGWAVTGLGRALPAALAGATPFVWVDGVPASPAVWAARLHQRLDPGA